MEFNVFIQIHDIGETLFFRAYVTLTTIYYVCIVLEPF